MTYSVKSCSRNLACFLTAFLQHIEDSGNILFKLFAAVAYRSQFLLQYRIKEFLHFHITESASLIMGFKFIKTGIIGQIRCEMFSTAESIQIGEDSIALYFSGI